MPIITYCAGCGTPFTDGIPGCGCYGDPSTYKTRSGVEKCPRCEQLFTENCRLQEENRAMRGLITEALMAVDAGTRAACEENDMTGPSLPVGLMVRMRRLITGS